MRFGTDEPGGENNPIAFWLIMGPALLFTIGMHVLMCMSAPFWLVCVVGVQATFFWSLPCTVDWLCRLGLIDSVQVERFLEWTKRCWYG